MTTHYRRHGLQTICLLAAFAIAGAASGPDVANAAEDDASTARLTIRFAPADLRDQPAALRLLTRIGDAALEVCGASPFSLPELQRLTRASSCWHDAVSGAVASIGAPQLTAALDAGRNPNSSATAFAMLKTSRAAAAP